MSDAEEVDMIESVRRPEHVTGLSAAERAGGMRCYYRTLKKVLRAHCLFISGV
jgi:hypothetical protein